MLERIEEIHDEGSTAIDAAGTTAPRVCGEGEQAERGDPLGAAVVKPPDAPRLK